MIILKRKIAGLSAASLARFVLRGRRSARLPGSVNILLTGNAEMRSLNLQFRNKNKATDVLSFPSDAEISRHGLAGEIAISADIAANNALRYGHSAAVEVKILALHGILHLAGFDHESDNGQMARKEAALRQTLSLPSSLTERGASSRQQRSHRQGSARSTRRRRTA